MNKYVVRSLSLLSLCFMLHVPNVFAAANEIIVAKSGGNFTTIQAAINSVNPTADNPYIIRVMPGTYTENVQINMKSYIVLEGSGFAVTTIQSPSSSDNTVWIIRCSNVALKGFTITGGNAGLWNYQQTAPVTISENRFMGNQREIVNEDASPVIAGNLINPSATGTGISNSYNSSPRISNNIITGIVGPYGGQGKGISGNTSQAVITGNKFIDLGIAIESYNASPSITDNQIISCFTAISNSWYSAPIILGNAISGSYLSMANARSAPTISNNTILGGNTVFGTSYGGISNSDSSSPTITNNRVTGNTTDIIVSADSTPNISFNVYDTLSGTTGVGLYNVNSSGNPAPAP